MSHSKDIPFLGRGWSFPPSFEANTCRIELVEGEEDIRQSLRILLNTVPGERLMYPEYGCHLKTLVFESLNQTTLYSVQNAIKEAVLFHESRITLDSVDVDMGDQRQGLLMIKLSYMIKTTNTRSNLVYPFYLEEGTSSRL